MDSIDFYNQILADSGNFALVIFGFAATLFTVVFSFIITERDKLFELSNKIKSGTKDPKTFEKEGKVKKRIKGYKELNSYLLIALVSNFLIYCVAIFAKYFISSILFKKYIAIGVGVLMILFSIYIIVILAMVITRYFKITKT